jgi:uncharacterized membrane protein
MVSMAWGAIVFFTPWSTSVPLRLLIAQAVGTGVWAVLAGIVRVLKVRGFLPRGLSYVSPGIYVVTYAACISLLVVLHTPGVLRLVAAEVLGLSALLHLALYAVFGAKPDRK